MQTIFVAKAVIIDERGKCLVLYRSKTHPDSALKPDLPGGRVENNESPVVALLREIKEETGMAVALDDVQVAFSSSDIFDDKNFVRLLFIVRVAGAGPTVMISWEHDSATWMSLTDLQRTIDHPVYSRGISHIITNNLAEL